MGILRCSMGLELGLSAAGSSKLQKCWNDAAKINMGSLKKPPTNAPARHSHTQTHGGGLSRALATSLSPALLPPPLVYTHTVNTRPECKMRWSELRPSLFSMSLNCLD